MISRRGFIFALAAQPLVLSEMMQLSVSTQNLPTQQKNEDTEFVVVGGWTMLRNDFSDIEP